MDDGASLCVRVKSAHGLALVYVSGEIDLSTAGLLARRLDAVLQDVPSWVCVDLSTVDFCDCHGFSCLLDATRRARRQGSRFVTTGLRPHLLRAIDLLGMREDLGYQAGKAEGLNL